MYSYIFKTIMIAGSLIAFSAEAAVSGLTGTSGSGIDTNAASVNGIVFKNNGNPIAGIANFFATKK